jgi:CHAD domain-containing protein
MAFRFKRKESVSKAIRRLGRKRIKAAIKCLKDNGQPEAIHCVRKEIKKTRAVLRLARTGIGKREYRTLNERLREAANCLSSLRDAYVKNIALKNLSEHFKGRISSKSLRSGREILQTSLRAEKTRFSNENTAWVVEHLLRQACKDFDRLDIAEKGWQVLGPGVKTAYKRGRKALRRARKEPSPQNFHDWRKHVKNLWHQLQLLCPMDPKRVAAMARETRILGEHLGEAHDLFVLRHIVGTQGGSDGKPQKSKTLGDVIEKRQRELRSTALEIGARFYAEKPPEFSHRLGRLWRRWR